MLLERRQVAGRVVAPAIIGAGCEIAPGAIVGGRTVLGHGVTVGEGTHVESSVLLDGVRVGARATVRGAIIGSGAEIGDHCHIEDRVMLGEGVDVGPDNVLAAGALSSRASNCQRERSNFDDSADLTRDAVAAIDQPGQIEDILACPTTCATRCGGSSRPT